MRNVFAIALAALAALALSGCAHRRRAARVPAPPSASPSAPPTASVPRRRPPEARPVEIGHTETGLASWYGHPYHGRAAANGEIYDMEKLTAAHRTLPFNTWVRVENLTNGRTVEVRIIDRGPFVDGRIIDLSHAAAQAIELIGPGVARVRMMVIRAPETVPAGVFAVQVGAFRDRAAAERVRAEMASRYGAARLVERSESPGLWRVMVGAEATEEGANALSTRIRLETGEKNAFVVRLDT